MIFERGCGKLKDGCANLSFVKVIAENCTKMKEIVRGGGG